MKRTASARWKGPLKEGKGSITTDSGTLSDTPYSFRTRFESGDGTNPEELIAAAHAGCYSMALSMLLGNNGYTVERIDTKASITLDKTDDGFEITAIHLDVTASVPDADQTAFLKVANDAKDGCPVSKVLNAKITLDAKLKNK